MQTIRIFSNISGMFGFNVWKYFFIRIIKTKIDEFGNILLVYFLFANGKEQYLGIIRISSSRFLIIREIIVGAWWEISRTEQSFSPFSCQLLDCWKSFCTIVIYDQHDIPRDICHFPPSYYILSRYRCIVFFRQSDFWTILIALLEFLWNYRNIPLSI